MPIPFLLGGAAVLATVIGASSHKDAKENNEKAERISRKAQNLYNDAKESLEDAKDEAEKKLLKLGYEKKNTLDGSMKQFVQVYDRIKNIQLKESEGLNEISSFSIEQQDIVQIKEMSDIYSSSMQSGAAGAATGAVIALAASGSLPMVTGALSLAGTCLSLGSVGAAASIAGTAITTAISATPLAAVVAPAVFFTGVSASMKADENLEKAEEMYAKAEKASEEMKVSETLCTAIGERAEMFDNLLVKLNDMFSDSTDMLCNVIREKDKLHGSKEINVDDLSEEELELIAVTRALAGAVKAVIDTPILTEKGKVSKESLNVYDSTKKSLPQFSETVLKVRREKGWDKEKEVFKYCMDTLGETGAMVDKYDNVKNILYITLEQSCRAQEDALKIKNAFIKAGYPDIRVSYRTRLIDGMSFDSHEYYYDQYNEILKQECFEPLIHTFLNQYLDCNMSAKASRESNSGNSSKSVKNVLFTVTQVKQNMLEVYQNFDIHNTDERNRLSCLIMAILHASGLANNNIVYRFIFTQQDKEIVYSISTFLSNGEMSQSMEKFISELSKDTMKKAIEVGNWEIEYINEYISDTVKEIIKEYFRMGFMI